MAYERTGLSRVSSLKRTTLGTRGETIGVVGEVISQFDMIMCLSLVV